MSFESINNEPEYNASVELVGGMYVYKFTPSISLEDSLKIGELVSDTMMAGERGKVLTGGFGYEATQVMNQDGSSERGEDSKFFRIPKYYQRETVQKVFDLINSTGLANMELTSESFLELGLDS